MERLKKRIGRECSLEAIPQQLCEYVREQKSVSVGALHVYCSDESEFECTQAFQTHFVDHVLPELKEAVPTAMQTANLGARYETGSCSVLEHHYNASPGSSQSTLLIVKINGHVAVDRASDNLRFGQLMRYGQPSAACGALHAFMAGVKKPFADEFTKQFCTDGCDRFKTLMNESSVDPAFRSLLIAVTSTLLQARRAVEDICNSTPTGPTKWIVLPCITLNQPGPDTELLCGLYELDWDGQQYRKQYVGLGDLPEKMAVKIEDRFITITSL